MLYFRYHFSPLAKIRAGKNWNYLRGGFFKKIVQDRNVKTSGVTFILSKFANGSVRQKCIFMIYFLILSAVFQVQIVYIVRKVNFQHGEDNEV